LFDRFKVVEKLRVALAGVTDLTGLAEKGGKLVDYGRLFEESGEGTLGDGDELISKHLAAVAAVDFVFGKFC
jgi:hypothetical protein